MKQILLITGCLFSLLTSILGQNTEGRTYNINASDSWQVPVAIRSENGRVSGRFVSADARTDLTVSLTDAANAHFGIPNTVQNNIEIMILNDTNYANWQNGRTYMAMRSTGRLSEGRFNWQLPRGYYKLIISNKHSALASKQVKVLFDDETEKLLGDKNVELSATPKEQAPTPIFPIVDSRFIIKAQGYSWFNFMLPNQHRISGRYFARGGSNDIELMIMTPNDFNRWQQGLYSSVFYQSGYLRGEQTFERELPAGYYVLVFNNKIASYTPKDVTAFVTVQPLQ